MTGKGTNSYAYITLLILAYLSFFQDKVQDGFLKSTFNILLILLMVVMIIDKSLDLYSRYLHSKKILKD